MGKRIKFNVRDLLFPEQHEPNVDSMVKLLLASPLLPAVAQIYNESNKAIRVGKTVMHSNGTIRTINMVNPLGLLVGGLNSTGTIGSGGEVSCYSPWVPHSYIADRRGLSTANPRYLVNKVKMSSDHPAGVNLHHSIREANKFIGGQLRSILDQMIDTDYGSSLTSAPTFKATALNETTGTYMARVVAGEISYAEFPANVRQDFERVFSSFKERRQKFKDSITNARQFLDGEKWLYLPDINNGVLLGAIRPEPMLAALETYSNGGHLPFESDEYTYVQESVPFKWYKSFDHIPEELRAGLEYSLVMLKMHRASEDMLPKHEDAKFWREMGCYSSNSAGKRSPVLLLAK